MQAYFTPGILRRLLLMALPGVFTCGVSVGIFKQAAFGVDPFRCPCAGFAMGCAPGVGTLITAFFMGPLISCFNKTAAEPMPEGHA